MTGDLLSSRLQRYVLFDRVNRPYLAWQMSLFLPHLGRRILEIGCGVGGIVDLLPPKDLILGIDIEDEVLSYAAERHRARAECRFEHLDFTALTAEDRARLAAMRFDTIVCINLLEHIEDDVAALEMMRGLLMPAACSHCSCRPIRRCTARISETVLLVHSNDELNNITPWLHHRL